MAGADGIYERWRPHLAGFGDVQSFHYDEDVVYTHEEWRGRIRACNGFLIDLFVRTRPEPRFTGS